MQRILIKVCGITTLEDALFAASAGADALGFVFYEKSPRYISPAQAGEITGKLPPFVQTVGVFVNEDAGSINRIVSSARLGCVQLHGDEEPEACDRINARVIKAFRVKASFDLKELERYKNASALLLDTFVEGEHGGTGKSFDWKIAFEATKIGRIILSGGLTPENIATALKSVRPYALDVSSGVETSPGKKDHNKIARFIAQVREYEKATG